MDFFFTSVAKTFKLTCYLFANQVRCGSIETLPQNSKSQSRSISPANVIKFDDAVVRGVIQNLDGQIRPLAQLGQPFFFRPARIFFQVGHVWYAKGQHFVEQHAEGIDIRLVRDEIVVKHLKRNASSNYIQCLRSYLNYSSVRCVKFPNLENLLQLLRNYSLTPVKAA